MIPLEGAAHIMSSHVLQTVTPPRNHAVHSAHAASHLITPYLTLCKLMCCALQAVDLAQDDWTKSSLTVVVVGASGDLAKKKIFPALFALFYEGLLPPVGSCRCVRERDL